MKIKKQNNIILLAKVIIIILSISFIGFKLKQSGSFSFINIASSLASQPYIIFTLFISVLLVLLNWALEAIKWKLILKNTEKLSFYLALKSVFSGTAIGFVTPNRMGEFAGKLLFLKEENRVNATYLSSIASAAQLLVTLIAGLLSLLFLNIEAQNYFTNALISTLQFIAFIGIIIICIFLFYNDFFFKKIAQLNFVKNLKISYTQYNKLKKTTVFIILLCSLLRYITFIGQYYLIFYIFNLNCNIPLFTMLTSFYFLLLAAIPTFFIAEIGIRGSAALFVYSFVFLESELVLSAVFSIWILNLALPAIAGVFFILKNKTSRYV